MKTLITHSPRIAAKFIRKGCICAFPTETVYGLGANAFDENAVKKIFIAKNRPADNPLIVHISDLKDINILAEEITPAAEKIIDKFFPGPVTIILKKNEIIPSIVTAGLSTIAIRMPSNPIANKFIYFAGVPIAAPSANISGTPSPTEFHHVLNDFNGKIPCILSGPPAQFGIESTVIDCTGKFPVIIRPGSVTLEQLKKISKHAQYKRYFSFAISPGLKYKHYSPKAKIILFNKQNFKNIIKSKKNGLKSACIIVSKGSYKRYKLFFQKFTVCPTVFDYAKNLFAFFRTCDKENINLIYCQKVSEKGIGLALMNRLNKASK